MFGEPNSLAYLGFGHQLVGIYVTVGSGGFPSATAVVHTTLSDENPDVVVENLPKADSQILTAPGDLLWRPE
jgi:hypothetical protein